MDGKRAGEGRTLVPLWVVPIGVPCMSMVVGSMGGFMSGRFIALK